MRKTLKFRGYTLLLDSSEIYPDDPGNGTPAIVESAKGSATYHYALSEGCLYDSREDFPLPQSVLDWLESPKVENEIEAMYAAGPDGVW